MADTTPGLIAAHRTSRLIGRQRDLEKIRSSIYETGEAFRVVFVRGPRRAAEQGEPEGGYGKTRLLEEVQRLLSNPDRPWQPGRDAAVSDVIDLIDIHLHAQSNFVHAVRNGYSGRVNFAGFDDAYSRYQRRLNQGMEYRAVREAAEQADRAFLSDYQAAARDQRLVWLLDTTEQLAIVSSEWLLDRQLLTSDDMQTRTLEWLKRQITARALPNTTLVCAGRGREGRRFFDELAAVVREVYGEDAIVEIWTEPFTIDETQEYFQVLADDLGHGAKDGTPHIARSYDRFAKTIGYLATDADRAKVVWLYTGGVPVRLALYAQLVAEGRTIPEELQWSWKDATSRVQTETPEETTAQLELTQWQIEEYFINMLFDPRNATDLGYRILLALVRARRGLTAEQLHFILDNTESLEPKQWETSVNTRRIRQIDDQLKQMEGLFLVKARPAWWRLGESVETGPLPGAERRGLQDEIYRLFAEHMSPNLPTPAPGSRLARIWAAQQPADQERYGQNRQDEQQARQTLYEQLRKWALYQRDKLYQQRREYQDNDEHALRLFNPADARRVAFTPLGERERARRLAIRAAIHELDLEYMYYSLLLDPEKGFNEDYYELSNRQLWAAEDEGYDILIQAEMWRVLHDEDALRFVDFVPRQSIFERHETSLLVLRRAAQQDDAARWIRRFFFRKEYKRAAAFADSIEAAVEPLQFGTQQDRNDWASWNHTFARGQRLCWRQYALVTTASDVRKAVDDLASMVADLELLAHKTLFEVAIPASRSLTGQDEQGFKGVPGSDPRQPVRHHPGYRMLRRVISIGYNILGYGSVNLGLFRQSLKYYGAALYYIRETGVQAHRANVLNNLSRVLSDMGRMRAARVCADGLELRRQLGEEVPIALSHNTLALIYNDRNAPEEAWQESALAVAYFRRAEEPRGLGLALLQLGEALRRIANKSRYRELPSTDAEQLYSIAEDLLNEAHSLFLPIDPDNPEPGRIDLKEPARRIEARIELGCLHRDRIRAADGPGLTPRWKNRYRDALHYLELAAEEAEQLSLERHALDARVNQAWTHFYAREFGKAQDALDLVDARLHGRHYFILPRMDGFAGYTPKPAELENLLIFAQLSKMCGLRGLMAIDQFVTLAKEIEDRHPGDELREYRQQLIHDDAQAKQRLYWAAEYYSLGAWYAQLYSPRSSALTLLYDRLYSYIKKFNGREQDDFYRAVREQRLRYPADEIRDNIEDLGNIEQFLFEVAGLSDELVDREGGGDV